ncbi:RND family transporter [Kangiella sp. HZ709]|uniref:efflux RND transporter permease subunit n=1 Tax=Kangiella sp. HZ709 TaxID=2666328 RepID=UPI0012AFD5B9|nr:efflux RND transporter permease subunit [Kangiella sp. HZ709]MRX27867.1 MMPL family transporter [Kangiella sp. HZ709]
MNSVQQNNDTKTVKFGQFVVNNKWLVLFLSIAISFLAAFGASFLEIKTDYRVFFSKDNPQMLAFEDIQDTYDKADNVMFVLTPKDGKVFTKQTLKTIHWITEEGWKAPYATRVDSVTNYQHTWVSPDDEDYMLVGALLCIPDKSADMDSECEHDAVTESMIDGLTEQQISQLSEIILNEPQLKRRLINPEKTVTAVNITVQPPSDPDVEGLEGQAKLDKQAEVMAAVPKITQYVRDLKQQIEARDPNIEVRMTGVIMMNNAFAETGLNDMMTLTPLMLLLVIPLALFFMLRSVGGTIASVFVIILSIVASMGGAGWLGIYMTGPVFSVPTIVATMAVADSVHLLVTFLQNMRRGMSKNDAMVESIRINMMPIFLTSITTIIGFLTMNFSEVPPLRDLGNVVSIGVAWAFFLSVTFLPALMLILPVKAKVSSATEPKMMDTLADFVITKRKFLLPAMAVLSIVIIAFLPKNDLNDEFVKYFDETIDFRADSDYTAENLTGLYVMFYSVKSGQQDGIHESTFLDTIEDFANFAKEQDAVLHVQSYGDVMKRLNKSMNGDKQDCYQLPKQSLKAECNAVLLEPDEEGIELDTRLRELTAQYTLMYETSLPRGMDLNNQLNGEKSSTRIQLALKNISSKEVIALEEKFANWFVTNAPSYSISASSPAIMFSHVGQRNIYSMIKGTAIALILISIILGIALKSVRLGFLSLIPNIIPMAVAFGIWGIFKGQVGMGLSVVMGMTLGIVVDDTVHFLSKYLRAYREKGMQPPEAVRYAFQTVGMALTVTTIVLVLGFLVLGMSHYVMNAEMGIMTAITLAAALIIDFLLLPPLLMLSKKRKQTNEV